jgi:hypothetical protein
MDARKKNVRTNRSQQIPDLHGRLLYSKRTRRRKRGGSNNDEKEEEDGSNNDEKGGGWKPGMRKNNSAGLQEQREEEDGADEIGLGMLCWDEIRWDELAAAAAAN